MPPLLASRRAVAYGWLAGDRPEAPTFPPPSTCLVESELEKKEALRATLRRLSK